MAAAVEVRLLGPFEVRVAGRLDIDPAHVDVLRFCQLLDEAQATGESALARQRLDDALAMWRGEPFAGLGSETLQRDQAVNLTERYLSAVQWRVDLDLSAGQGAELVAQLRALTAEHPLREPLWARLMVALCAAGRQAEALQAYEQARTVLADALGADPGPELRKLHHENTIFRSTPPTTCSTSGTAKSAMDRSRQASATASRRWRRTGNWTPASIRPWR